MNKQISELKPHPNNETIYGKESVEDLVIKIKDSNWIKPLTITQEGTIISGHRRYYACKELGITDIPVEIRTFKNTNDELEALLLENVYRVKTKIQMVKEGSAWEGIEAEKAKERISKAVSIANENRNKENPSRINLPHLGLEQEGKTRDIIADKVGFGSGSDYDNSKKVVAKIDDLKAKGEIQKADTLSAILEKSTSGALNIIKEDKIKNITQEISDKIKSGEITVGEVLKDIKKEEKAEKKEIKLSEIKAAAKEIPTPIGGDYQYKIGDCMEHFKTIQDKSVKLFLTDIPYDEVNRESNGLRNLNVGVADIKTFDLDLFLKEAIRITNGSIYIFCGMRQLSQIKKTFDENNMSARLCIWEKTNPTVLNGDSLWLSGVECCVYGKFANATFNGHCLNTVWRHPIVANHIHPTQKPLELIKNLIKISSHEGDLVFDSCMGSGIVLKAAKELNRKFNGCELSLEWEYNYKNIINGV